MFLMIQQDLFKLIQIWICFNPLNQVYVFNKNNLPITEMDLFYAGYVIANPIVRENLLKERKREIKREKELCE